MDTYARMWARRRPWRDKRRAYSSLYVSAILYQIMKYKIDTNRCFKVINVLYDHNKVVQSDTIDFIIKYSLYKWNHVCGISLFWNAHDVKHEYRWWCIYFLDGKSWVRGIICMICYVGNWVLWLCKTKFIAPVSQKDNHNKPYI